MEQALSAITAHGSSNTYGAAYLAIQNQKGFAAATEWLTASGLSVLDLDDDAVVRRIYAANEVGMQKIALEIVEAVGPGILGRSVAANSVIADLYLSGAIPEIPWASARQTTLISLESVPLKDDPEGMILRRKASARYSKLSIMAANIGLKGVSSQASDWHLWLDLKDPETSDSARRDLEQSLNNPDEFLRRFIWAKQCGINVDLNDVDREISRQVALSGGTRFEHSAARYAMAMAQETPKKRTEYLARHRDHILQHLDPKLVLVTETAMLIETGDVVSAAAHLIEAEKAGVDEDVLARIRAQVKEAEGQDVIFELLANYKNSESIFDLRSVVMTYTERNDYDEAVKFGKILVDRAADAADVRRLAVALYNSDRPEDTRVLIEQYPFLLANDQQMRLLHVQSLYDVGQINQAMEILTELRHDADTDQARLLYLQCTLTSGDWDSLQAFIEEQWRNRGSRSPMELVQAGQLSQYIGTPRGEGLIRLAAENAPDDAMVLTACYHAASSAGWEDDPEVSSWLQKAADLSENLAEGPIQRVSLDFIFERQPKWEAHESRMSDLAIRGEAPLFAVAKSLNQPFVRMVLLEALSNIDERDVRKRSMIMATSGARSVLAAIPEDVALDPIALLSASLLNLLGAYREGFRKIWIPHETLGWLFEERSQLRFHQPSRVSSANELQQSVANGLLQVQEAGNPAPEALVREVGSTMADLLTDAAMAHTDENQRVVVLTGQVWKVGSIMSIEADLTDYTKVTCTVRNLLQELIKRSVLTDSEIKTARMFPELRAMPDAPHPIFEDGAVLLLDNSAVSMLQAAGLFKAIQSAGFAQTISQSVTIEARQLISHDAKAGEALSIVERLRAWLQQGIEEGWVCLGRSVRRSTHDEDETWSIHPTASTLALAKDADACVIDDRFMNRHANMVTDGVNTPILTTWDILDILFERNVIDTSLRREARTMLRKAGFTISPIGNQEIYDLLTSAPIVEEKIVETVELRALRESVARLRMSDVLQAPVEIPWLGRLQGACLYSLKSVWTDGTEEEHARARSDWLLDLGDPDGWCHRITSGENSCKELLRRWVGLLLMLTGDQPEVVRKSYWRWLDDRVLGRLKDEQPAVYANILEDTKARIEAAVEHIAKPDTEEDG